MRKYLALVAYFNTLQRSCAQQILDESNHRELQRHDKYQVYWYVDDEANCFSSDKFDDFGQAWAIVKELKTKRRPLMVINDPYVFNRVGDAASLSNCIKAA